MNTTGSPRFTINGADVWKTIRGALITLASVLLTAIIAAVSSQYMDWTYNACLGATCMDLRVFMIPVIGGLLEFGRRYLSNFSAPV